MQTVHETLILAREFVSQGWTQGHAVIRRSNQMGVCILGALTLATPPGKKWTDTLYFPAAMELTRLLGGQGNFHLIKWNDAPERTKEEVLALLDEAIAATAPEPSPLERCPELKTNPQEEHQELALLA